MSQRLVAFLVGVVVLVGTMYLFGTVNAHEDLSATGSLPVAVVQTSDGKTWRGRLVSVAGSSDTYVVSVTPEGRVVRVVHIPAEQVTVVKLGGGR